MADDLLILAARAASLRAKLAAAPPEAPEQYVTPQGRVLPKINYGLAVPEVPGQTPARPRTWRESLREFMSKRIASPLSSLFGRFHNTFVHREPPQ